MPLSGSAKDVFLAYLGQTGNVSAAARKAGLSRSQIYRHRKVSKSFAKKWDEALEESLDILEEALRDRAVNGVDKPVFYGGKKAGSIRTYSDTLGMFLLKARRPEIFSGNFKKSEQSFSRDDSSCEEKEILLQRLEEMIVDCEKSFGAQNSCN